MTLKNILFNLMSIPIFQEKINALIIGQSEFNENSFMEMSSTFSILLNLKRKQNFLRQDFYNRECISSSQERFIEAKRDLSTFISLVCKWALHISGDDFVRSTSVSD